MAGQGASGLHIVCLALTLFSFQGYPGPKGEMVRPQLSCLPSRGGGSAWTSRATAKHCPANRPSRGSGSSCPKALPSCAQCMPLGPHINEGRRGGQGASPHEKRGKGVQREFTLGQCHGVRG